MNKSQILLILIIALALALRLFRIDKVPARMTHDEMSFAYNAYSILKTGKDEWGVRLPMIFRAFGDYKLPAYIYATVPFIGLLGLNILSARIVSILSGVLLVILVYKIAKLVAPKSSLGIWAALVMAISPWSVHISRMAVDSHIGAVLFVGGIYALMLAQKTPFKNKYYVATGIFWALSCYAYIAYRLLVMLGVGYHVLSLIIYKKKTEYKNWSVLIATLFICLLPLLSSVFSTAGMARFKTVSLFTNPGIAMQINEKRAFCYLNDKNTLPTICKLFFNKGTVLAATFISNWAEFFSPSFLFISGDKNPYLSVPGYGVLLLAFLPFYVYGLFTLFTKSSYAWNLIKFIILIAPVPAALTEYPQIIRGSLLMPLLSLVIALGVSVFWETISFRYVKTFKTIFILVLIYMFGQFYIDYFYVYPSHWDDAAYSLDRRLTDYIGKDQNKYEEIYIDDQFPDAYILFAFYNEIDPQWLQDNIVRNDKDNFGFSHPKKLGKLNFISNPQSKILEYVCGYQDKNYLFITKPYQQLQATETYYNFSHVHPQVSIFETKRMRENYQQANNLSIICGGVTKI